MDEWLARSTIEAIDRKIQDNKDNEQIQEVLVSLKFEIISYFNRAAISPVK